MNRHEIREAVFKIAFQNEFYPGKDLDEQIENYFKDPIGENVKDDTDDDPEIDLFEISEEEKEEIREEAKDLFEKIPEIDALINEKTEGWKTDRMGKVDLTAIRLSVYEMRYRDMAPGISINEAVDLAKKYGAEKSHSFVNGVLARIAP
ncbi:MAG: transcription antitermination factor NusB [Lachnospiraceae bacterium]|nr:transcription antitermination factor NusB [Lachnospiraceae bacterium]